MQTFMPAFMKRLAAANPMPDAPPVTTAVFPGLMVECMVLAPDNDWQ
jgi:hypothetical protein